MSMVERLAGAILRFRYGELINIIERVVSIIKIARDDYVQHMSTLYTRVDSSVIRNKIRSALISAGIDADSVDLILLDSSYYIPTHEQFKILTEFIRDDFMSYYKDVFDSDDYSLVFKAEMQAIALLNNVAFVTGTLVQPDGSRVKYSWNIVLLKDDDIIRVYTYEPRTNTLAWSIQASIDGKKYTPEFILM